jgi:DNA-binding transcriptional LysR family regulator
LGNEIDIGFIGTETASPDIQSHIVAEDEIVCIASPRHKLAKQRKPSAEMLKREICVVREEGSATRELYDEWLARAGTKLQRTIRLSCPEAVKALVGAGVGFSFLSIYGVRAELRSGKLAQIRMPGLNLTRRIYRVRHREKHESPVIAAFLKLIVASLA